jgi:hypothetical protein
VIAEAHHGSLEIRRATVGTALCRPALRMAFLGRPCGRARGLGPFRILGLFGSLGSFGSPGPFRSLGPLRIIGPFRSRRGGMALGAG